jgi:CheY-like chemotaxis protein
VPHTLLLADDSVTIQRVIELTFADEDIAVIAVGDGDHAIASIRHTPPDIVLADVGMPGRSGYEVAHHVKHTPALAHIPVLLLTGAFEPIDPVRAEAAGCDGVLTKPFEPQFLIQRVKALLEASRPPVAAATPDPLEPRPEAVAHLDDYFEQLDQAFTSRIVEGTPPAVMPASEPEQEPTFDREDHEYVGPLSGAFSALLAAERAGVVPEAFADWLPPAPVVEPAPPEAPPIGDDVIDAIVRRVLERLPDTVVREAVAALASETAERLVREEIERIKSNIK